MTIYSDRQGAVTCDMKTLDMIKQYKQAVADPKEPPVKQQKTAAVAASTLVTPKTKEAPKDPIGIS